LKVKETNLQEKEPILINSWISQLMVLTLENLMEGSLLEEYQHLK